MKKYRELTREEKKRLLVFMKHSYDMRLRGVGLCMHARRAYYSDKINYDQYMFFKELLKNRYKSLGCSYGDLGESIEADVGYYWLKNDREIRLKWIDEQIKMVENGEI